MAEDEPLSRMAQPDSTDITGIPTPDIDFHISEKAPPFRAARILSTVFCLAVLSASIMPLNEYLSRNWWNYLFLVEAIMLCAITPGTCGLVFRKAQVWRRRVQVAVVWLVPPLLVVTVYAHFTSRPFHGVSAEIWLVQSVAQEFFFSGFVYGRLCALWGDPKMDWRGAFAWSMLVLMEICTRFIP